MDNSANSKKIPAVTIIFDGLMLFHYDTAYDRCEVRFRRADAHEMKIKVYKIMREGESEGQPNWTYEPSYDHERLIQYDKLRLQKGHYENPGTAAVRGNYYDEILQLDGEDFYGGMGTLKMKSGQYHPTLLLCVGRVGTRSVTVPCKRVTKTDDEVVSNGLTYSFAHLKYGMSSDDWDKLACEFNGLIKTINPFSRWVEATIDLAPQQDLILKGTKPNGGDDTLPLVNSYNEQHIYLIYIANLDLPGPQSLGHCKGMAHLCESFDLNGQPLYGVFASKFQSEPPAPSPPWTGIPIESTDVTCCLCARVEQFQEARVEQFQKE